MELLNSLSLPQAQRLLARRQVEADCTASETVGKLVYISDEPASGRYQVRVADPSDIDKMPAVGLVIEKPTSTTCKLVLLGEISGTLTGLTIKKPVFVGDGGDPTQVIPTPPSGEVRYVQVVGTSLGSDVLMFIPNYLLVKRIAG